VRRIDWPVLIIIIAGHVAALSCLLVPPTRGAVVLFLVFQGLAGFGVTVGFHRLISHRAFECDLWLKRVWVTLGTMALLGGPVFWAGLHRGHHRFADQEGDPHSPRETFWEGHMLWMARRETKDGAVLASLTARDLRELSRDRYVRWLDRGFGPLVPWAISLGICFAIGGLPGLVWGGFARTLYVWHSTWLVNSAGHVWGDRPHATPDGSRNVWWLMPIALGEMWHNNHHASPRSAVFGEKWWQIDPSGMLIVFFEKLGLHRDVHRRKAGSPSALPKEEDSGNQPS
jgi:stearoyl-CoA desaturase (delta-9 desaturase)